MKNYVEEETRHGMQVPFTVVEWFGSFTQENEELVDCVANMCSTPEEAEAYIEDINTNFNKHFEFVQLDHRPIMQWEV